MHIYTPCGGMHAFFSEHLAVPKGEAKPSFSELYEKYREPKDEYVVKGKAARERALRGESAFVWGGNTDESCD